jgi:hypothetical protein
MRAPSPRRPAAGRPASAALLALGLVVVSPRAAAAPARPRLGVLVVFDQLPSWALDRAAPWFDDGGFGGLDGARHDAWFRYAGTETAPGHATLATGAPPVVHGIATNTWFEAGRKVYAVDDAAHPVFAPTAADPAAKAPYGRSAGRLRAPTLGDTMKLESDGRARVVAVSHKDRSAVLSAGRAGDLAVWYDPQQGRYTTSTAYAPTLPSWLAELGRALPEQAMASGTWSPLPAPPALQALLPDDDRAGEGALKGFDRTFPHDLKDVADDLRNNGYRLVPQSMDDLFTLALRAVDEEGLGRDAEPDLLVVSVSTTDIVGHNYGGESLEALDTLRRADVALRRFVSALESKVGRGRFVVGVTSDHGAPPLPEAMAATGFTAPTVSYEALIAVAEQAAAAAAPPPPPGRGGAARKDGGSDAARPPRVQGFFPPQLFVDVADLSAADADRVLGAVAAAVERIPGIARVHDLARADDDAFGPLLRSSSPPGRSARLFVRQDPRVVLLDKPAGTDHGTPYAYDQRVPFLLAGPGVRRGRQARPIDAVDVAASLAFALGVSPPDACQGTPVPALEPR